MPLAALIAAYQDSAEPGVLRAALPLAGRTVIERQARLAYAAGADQVIVLVERMPAGLSAALDRLRREGVPLKIAREVAEACEIVEPETRLVLLGDGAVVDGGQLERLAATEGAAVLTVADSAYGELYERIDGNSRWAGAAMLDGTMLRDTAAMLRDWDLQSTLLRRVLQAGAVHVPAEGPVTILNGGDDLANAERQILDSARDIPGGWSAQLLAPVERALTSLAVATPLTPAMAGTAGAALTAAGAGAIGAGWLRSGLALMVAATPLDGVAFRLARLRMQRDARRSWWNLALPVLAGAGLLGLAYRLAPAHGWGTILLGLLALAFLVAQDVEIRAHKPRLMAALADRKNMTLALVPFALLGAWLAGLAALFGYAAASFFWAQHEVHPARPKSGSG